MVFTKSSRILKTNVQLKAAGFFKYVWSFSDDEALKG